jgi:tetratricopeptide (TPR) repeat protein
VRPVVKQSWVPLLVYAAFGGVLCVAPPTRVLGYEAAWAVVVFTSIIGVWVLANASVLQGVISLSLPLVALLVNGLFVKNCDVSSGFAWYALLVPPHALLAVVLCRRMPRAPYIAFLCASVVWMIRGPLVGPSLRAYSLLLGFFAGSVYDEALPIPRALLWHSAMVCLFALTLVFQKPATKWGSLALGLGIFACGHAFGFFVDRDDLHQALSRTVATEHLVLHFPPFGPTARRMAEIWPEAERTAARVAEALGNDPRLRNQPTHVYLYDDADTKERLLGARHTLFTRPWGPELHVLNGGSESIPALGHELVHAFARVWTRNALGVPARAGVLIDLGLTEGLAVALSREEDGEREMAALKRLGRLPNVRALFGTTGFYLDSAPRAYTAAGAFITWLMRERGIDVIRRAYARGSLASQIDLDHEAGAFEKHLEEVDVDPRTVQALAERFSEKPLYARVCGREHAERRQDAARAIEGGRFDDARDIYARMQSDAPGDSSLALLSLELERRESLSHRTDGSVYETHLLQLLGSASPGQRPRLYEQLGDARVARGDTAGAAEAFSSVVATREDDARRLVLKRVLLLRADAAEIFSTLDGSISDARAVALLFQAFHRTPEDGIVCYLLARRLLLIGETARALPYLQAALETALPDEVRVETLRLRFDALWRVRERSAFAAAVDEYAQAASAPSQALAVENARDKARFYLLHETW